jgi:hypothetical protein
VEDYLPSIMECLEFATRWMQDHPAWEVSSLSLSPPMVTITVKAVTVDASWKMLQVNFAEGWRQWKRSEQWGRGPDKAPIEVGIYTYDKNV